MILNFIFSNLSIIFLSIWFLFLIVLIIRFFYPTLVRNISYSKLVFIALGLHIFFASFITWGQYYVWANGGDVTNALLNLPLSKQVPFPEWIRPFFENHFGYFMYYIFGHFWLDIFILFFISGILYLVFKFWKSYHGNFLEQGPELLLVLMLTSGYPGILFLIPLGLIFAIFLSVFYYFRGNKIINIELAFILATPFALLFSGIFLKYLDILMKSFN